jgi:SAM-dependent methyltransferase
MKKDNKDRGSENREKADAYWFVDENFKIAEGENAKELLSSISDAEFLTKDQGVVKVPYERWKLAQTFERRGWMEKWRRVSNDRNTQHMMDFDNYKALEGLKFNNAIEIGCGPFTNIRLISTICEIEKCTLLDPLIASYLHHKNCSYTQHSLYAGENCLSHFLSSNIILRGLRRGIKTFFPHALSRQHIKIEELIPAPAEEISLNGRYDLIIMINVIEHCYDIERVLNNILKIAAPGAYFVFNDKYYDIENITKLIQGHYYEAGHPLMVDRRILDEFMNKNFDHIYYRTLSKELPHIEVMPTYEGFFFIGRLLDS